MKYGNRLLMLNAKSMKHVRIKFTGLLCSLSVLVGCAATSNRIVDDSLVPAVKRKSIPSVSYSRDYPDFKKKEADNFR
jgi:hypothetical protein